MIIIQFFKKNLINYIMMIDYISEVSYFLLKFCLLEIHDKWSFLLDNQKANLKVYYIKICGEKYYVTPYE